jgi:hypothetical protein
MNEQLQQLLENIKMLETIKIPISLFETLAYYFIETETDLSELLTICKKQKVDYLEPLTETAELFNVLYQTPTGNTGIHVAVKANSIEDVIKRTPIMLSYGTQWKPSEFKILGIIPTPINDLPLQKC